MRKGRGDQSNGGQATFWEDQVNLWLINGGLEGRSQTELIMRFKSQISTEDLKNYMESLHNEGKVDKFSVPHESGKGKAKIVWRANTNLITQ